MKTIDLIFALKLTSDNVFKTLYSDRISGLDDVKIPDDKRMEVIKKFITKGKLPFPTTNPYPNAVLSALNSLESINDSDLDNLIVEFNKNLSIITANEYHLFFIEREDLPVTIEESEYDVKVSILNSRRSGSLIEGNYVGSSVNYSGAEANTLSIMSFLGRFGMDSEELGQYNLTVPSNTYNVLKGTPDVATMDVSAMMDFLASKGYQVFKFYK